MTVGVFTGTAIPWTDTDIPNSGRGPFEGIGVTPPVPYTDIYRRDPLVWSQIHTAPGAFNFAPFEAALGEAQSRGGRLGFRFMPWLNGSSTRFSPSWVPLQSGSTAPDWNASAYLSAWEEFWAALGAQYAGDPRILHIDLPMIGDCGEGGVYGPAAPTRESADRIIRAVLNAFPQEMKVTNWYSSPYSGLGWPEVVAENEVAVGNRRNVGIRNDWIGGGQQSYASSMAYVADAWKTAPMTGEFGHTATMTDATQNRTAFHMSSCSAGNLGVGGSSFTYDALSSSDKAAYVDFMKRLGFRIELRQLRVTTDPVAGGPVFAAATFANVGVAPTYDQWRVALVLSRSGADVWSTTLPGDLRALLGGGDTAEFSVSTFLPAGLSGVYDVGVSVTHTAGYLAPLRLATTGRTSSGTYPMGQITVGIAHRYVGRRWLRGRGNGTPPVPVESLAS